MNFTIIIIIHWNLGLRREFFDLTVVKSANEDGCIFSKTFFCELNLRVNLANFGFCLYL